MRILYALTALLLGCQDPKLPAARPASSAKPERALSVRTNSAPRVYKVVRVRSVFGKPALFAPAPAGDQAPSDFAPIDDAYELAIASPGDSDALHAYLDEVERKLDEMGVP